MKIDRMLTDLSRRNFSSAPVIDISSKVQHSIDELEISESFPFSAAASFLSALIALEIWLCWPFFFCFSDPVSQIFRTFLLNYSF